MLRSRCQNSLSSVRLGLLSVLLLNRWVSATSCLHISLDSCQTPCSASSFAGYLQLHLLRGNDGWRSKLSAGCLGELCSDESSSSRTTCLKLLQESITDFGGSRVCSRASLGQLNHLLTWIIWKLSAHLFLPQRSRSMQFLPANSLWGTSRNPWAHTSVLC